MNYAQIMGNEKLKFAFRNYFIPATEVFVRRHQPCFVSFPLFLATTVAGSADVDTFLPDAATVLAGGTFDTVVIVGGAFFPRTGEEGNPMFLMKDLI